MHKKSWRQGKCIFNLIRFLFLFFFISTFGRVTLSRSSFIQQIYFFAKENNFFHFQHCIFFNTFYSRHVSFFCQFSFNHTKNIFFSKKTDVTLIFLNFYSTFQNIFLTKMNKTLTFNFSNFFIVNKISSYFFTKKQN